MRKMSRLCYKKYYACRIEHICSYPTGQTENTYPELFKATHKTAPISLSNKATKTRYKLTKPPSTELKIAQT
jgi:hypothetical protein